MATIKMTFAERLQYLKDGKTLSLAVEGKYTNIRIWFGRLHAPVNPDNTMCVYMRLDCANQYSAPISDKSFAYLNNPDTPVKELVQFGFPANAEHLETIVRITKDMKERECIAW